MTRTPHLTAGLALLVMLSACNASQTVTRPTERPTIQNPIPPPSPPDPAPPSRSPVTGTIAFSSLSPEPGASLPVSQCLFGTVTRTCAENWRGTFTVSVDQEVRHAVLTVSFYSGGVRCGYAAAGRDLVEANRVVTFSPTRVALSDEFGTFSPPCPLPATTSRMVAVLWTDTDWGVQVTQDFAATYTFNPPLSPTISWSR